MRANQSHDWREQLSKNGAAAHQLRHDAPTRKLNDKIDALQAGLAHKGEVITETMGSHVAIERLLAQPCNPRRDCATGRTARKPVKRLVAWIGIRRTGCRRATHTEASSIGGAPAAAGPTNTTPESRGSHGCWAGNARPSFAMPEHTQSDNGAEFTAQAVRRWVERLETKPMFIEPGSAWANGYIECLNRDPRDGLPDRRVFDMLWEAQVLAERWRLGHDHVRPHSALGYRSPAPEPVEASRLRLKATSPRSTHWLVSLW